jgi:hypothetical protein
VLAKGDQQLSPGPQGRRTLLNLGNRIRYALRVPAARTGSLVTGLGAVLLPCRIWIAAADISLLISELWQRLPSVA